MKWILLILLIPQLVLGQAFPTLKIGDQGAIDSKAALEVKSTTKGFLPPRMTTTQRDNIASPTTGLQIFNTTTGKNNVYNGTAWQVVGSGGGGGGVNFVGMDSTFTTASQDDIDAETANGAWALFDDGAVTSPVDMTAGSTATLTLSRTTTAGEVLNGTASHKIVKTAADSQGEGWSVSMYIPVGYRGQNAQITIPFKVISGTLAATNLKVFAYDQTGAALAFAGSSYVTNTSIIIENFPVPSAAAQMRLGFMFTSTDATAATVSFDDVSFGPPKNIGFVSQSQMYGTLTIAGTTSPVCEWTGTPASFTNFAEDTDCATPTVTGFASAPATEIPGIKFANLPPGDYQFIAHGSFYCGANGVSECIWRFHDGTTGFGHINQSGSNSIGKYAQTLTGHINYTNAQSNVTIQIQGIGSSGVQINNIDNQQFKITVIRLPSSPEQAYKPDVTPNSYTGYHDAGCTWSRSNAAFGDLAAFGDNSGCDLVERTNSNMGTVTGYGATSGSSALPGIIFNPKAIGTYEVCANPSITGTAAAYSAFQMLDGATVLDEAAWYANGYYSPKLCGNVVATSLAAKTIKIYSNGSAGNTSYILPASGMNVTIGWSIKKIDQSFPLVKLSCEQNEVYVTAGNALGGSSSGETNVRNFTTAQVNVGTAITYTPRTTTTGDKFTLNQPGTYTISFYDSHPAAALNASAALSKNASGAELTGSIETGIPYPKLLGFMFNIINGGGASATTWLNSTIHGVAGDVIRAHGAGSLTNSVNTTTWIRITKHCP